MDTTRELMRCDSMLTTVYMCIQTYYLSQENIQLLVFIRDDHAELPEF